MSHPRVTLQQIKKPTTIELGLWLVFHDLQVVGILQKYKNSKDAKHPWRAFRGVGLPKVWVGNFYEDSDLKDWSLTGECRGGGKQAAINAILGNS